MRIRTALASATVAVVAAGGGVAVGATLEDDDRLAAPASRSVATDRVAVSNASLRPAQDCDALLGSYVERGLDLVTAYGWGGGPIYTLDTTGGATMAAERATGSPGLPSTVRSNSSETGTNVQEIGVDEPDVVKVAGDLLLRISDDAMRAYDVGGEVPALLSTLGLVDLHDAEVLLSGDRAVVVGNLGSRHRPTGARVVVVDVADPAAPQVVEQVDFSGTLSAARLHGGVVRVVLDSGLPDLDFRHPHGRLTENGALSFNQQLVRGTTLADWLPTSGGELAVDCAAVALPQVETTLGTTTVLTLEPALLDRSASAVATSAATTYFSTDRLYLTTSASSFGWWGSPTIDCIDVCGPGTDDGSTELFAFALDGTETTFVAAGSVDGIVRDRWSMDFADGALRLALGPTRRTGNFSSVVTMRESDATLTEVGRVDKLGVNEEIKSVRWFDDLALVVTFRQVDPLYAVDLSDPAAPELLGELKIPGFSEYLHPLGERRLIGVGQSTTGRGGVVGAQAALFDVTDLTSPQQLDVVKFAKGTTADAGLDPRQFTWLPDRRTALTVVSKGWVGRTGWVSVLSLAGGKMSNRMVEVEYGDEVAQVRLVPLADGRVVLVTGDAVSFFDV
ncbi:beta-propeller domain-containing protein [Nocardioides piscis]|uniref:Benzoate transporter n=1 Tax=Nocardioides piscis TaxID=2714938 RepID=A0A6G7YCF8_9ACTN|nr:beta-propeller domain-containing protein [Nocardioides piscis]QIK74409.1 hypothetical protein G7071_02105 [Nocardioides piscis]